MNDSYRAALQVLTQTGAGLDARRNRAAEVAPDFVRLALGFSHGDILARPGLDLKLRAFALVAAHAALGALSDELPTHVAAALHLGWSKADLIELLIQSATHAGIPTALRSLADCHDLLVNKDCHSGCDAAESSEGQL